MRDFFYGSTSRGKKALLKEFKKLKGYEQKVPHLSLSIYIAFPLSIRMYLLAMIIKIFTLF